MSLDEPKKLERKVQAAIAEFETRKRDEAIKAIAATAEEFGFALKDLIGSAPVRMGKVVAPKYAHPENPKLTWSGRGRQPAWFREAISKGVTKENLSA